MIDVMLLGTGAMVPLPGRWLSSAMIRTGGSLILLDCGEGTQIAMRERGWGFRKLDAICLSHLHADHVAGVPGLLHTVANAGKTTPLTIYGPAGTTEVIRGLRTIARTLPYELVVRELKSGDAFAVPARLHVRVVEGEHRVDVIAYRFDLARTQRFDPEKARSLDVPVHLWSVLQRGETVEIDGRVVDPAMVLGEARAGLSLGFVTDTRPTEEVCQLVTGVDLLIAEGTYGDDTDIDKAKAHRHMTFRESASLAAKARVGHLWLTHFSAGMECPEDWRENATSEFSSVTIGRSGLSGRLNFDEGYREIDAGEQGDGDGKR